MDSTGNFVIVLLCILIIGYIVIKTLHIIEWKIKKANDNYVNDDDIVREIDRDLWGKE